MENYIITKQTIKELLRSVPKQITKLYISQEAYGNDIKTIISLAKENGVGFLTVPKKKLIEIYNQGYSGVLAVVSVVEYMTLDELLAKTKEKSLKILVLDEIMDPQNFGSILRSAAAFEIDAVIIQQWNQAQVSQTVMDVSRGAVRIVPIVREKNVYNAVKRLKKEGFWIYGATVQPVDSFKKVEITNLPKDNIVIILGNEHKGIRKNVMTECDGFITIPHSGKMESLNVSVACGIILYEIYKINKESVK
jgi:23S rRNA (guanosine2251-2'-O)-methyltransferase